MRDRAESEAMWPRRFIIPDARGQGASLRVTRHPEQGKVVISHWREDVCVASTPVDMSELPALIGVLADALGDAVSSSESPPGMASDETRFLSRIRRWLRPRVAQIIDLRSGARENTDQEQTG
jgi:hypothetical protein